MTKQTIKTLILAFMTILVVSCDDLSQEPEAYPNSISFDVNGGTKPVRIKKRNGREYKYYATWIGSVGRMETDFVNGLIAYRAEWVEFRVSPDHKTITIVAQPNKTGQSRKCIFWGSGGKIEFYIEVNQTAI